MSDESEESQDRSDRASDVPLDLVKERETFVRSFLKKGVEYTEALLRENLELREELLSLRTDNARLRAQVASDDAIRDLLRTVDRLEQERNALMERSHQLEESRRRHEGRAAEIEQEVNDLANLYIATYQLHASLSVRRVLRHLRDMCGQLVGAEAFVIYVLDADGKVAHPIAFEEIDEAKVAPLPVGSGAIGDACITGIARIRELGPDTPRAGTMEDPIAVIPMLAEGRPIGVIAVITVLEQKERWAAVDQELFQLLGTHAGTALIAANLYSSVSNPVDALRGLIEKL